MSAGRTSGDSREGGLPSDSLAVGVSVFVVVVVAVVCGERRLPSEWF